MKYYISSKYLSEDLKLKYKEFLKKFNKKEIKKDIIIFTYKNDTFKIYVEYTDYYFNERKNYFYSKILEINNKNYENENIEYIHYSSNNIFSMMSKNFRNKFYYLYEKDNIKKGGTGIYIKPILLEQLMFLYYKRNEIKKFEQEFDLIKKFIKDENKEIYDLINLQKKELKKLLKLNNIDNKTYQKLLKNINKIKQNLELKETEKLLIEEEKYRNKYYEIKKEFLKEFNIKGNL